MSELLSVIIPVYKVEQYLDQCVESVVNQTYCNLDIILVDDGSPDKCGAMCDAWAEKDSRIRVVHKQNEGLGFARNSGLDVANGEYFAFLDSDDYLENTMYERLMEKAHKTGADIAVCGYYVQMPDGSFEAQSDFDNEWIICKGDILGLAQDFIYHRGNLSKKMEIVCRSVFKRETMNCRFLSEREIVSEDYYYQIAATLCAEKVAFITDCLYHYRYNGSGLSKTFSFDKFKKFPVQVKAINALFEPYSMPHAGDYCMIMITFNTIQRLYASDLQPDEIKYFLSEMVNNDVWDCIEIPYSKLSIQEKLIYFAMRCSLPKLLYYIMRVNYFIRGRKDI